MGTLKRSWLVTGGLLALLAMAASGCGPSASVSLDDWLSLQPLTAEAAFEITGRLDAVTDSSLIIDGREVSVGSSTVISPGLALGALVEVELIVLPDGSLMALRVGPSGEEAQAGGFELTGTVTASEGAQWTVGGLPVLLAEGAKVEPGIAVGVTVHVEGTIGPDGQLIVTEVSLGDVDDDAAEADEAEDEGEEQDDVEDQDEAEEAEDAEDGCASVSGSDEEQDDDDGDGEGETASDGGEDDGGACGDTDQDDDEEADDEREEDEDSEAED